MIILVSIVAGALAWTFAEYVLHRFAGHWARGRNHFSREHLRHHATPDYFSPTPQKLLFAALVVPVAGGIWALGLGLAAGLAFGSSFAAAYLGYEWLHRRLHTHAPSTRYGHWARRHHFHHHFGDPGENHGVTLAFWDRVFRTYTPVTEVRVPKKRVLAWMADAEGAIRPEFADVYVVGKRRSARA